ncbi:MAG TPA: NfeD family protein [Candidatus Wallbacteria bacterium]|nr:NfeD family protein [Candidatus Wallbacteria bacterium]
MFQSDFQRFRLPLLSFFLFFSAVISTIFFVIPLIVTDNAYAATTYVIPVRGTVEQALFNFMKRGLEDAKKSGSELIVIDINTFGGRVDAAIDISKLLRDESKKGVKIVAYVSENAWSAGALIAMSTPKIYMGKGSSIGSAEPKNSDTWTTDEKMISALRAEFKSVAEAMNYPKDLAEGMVDKDVEIKELKPKGKLLNMTAEQAVKSKFASEVLGSIEEVIAREKAPMTYFIQEETIGEKVARFVSEPMVSGILLNLGILGLTVEFWMPGHIAPGLAGLTCFALFFWGHSIASAGSMLPMMLFLIGVVLILLEVFVIPGFGLVGLMGIVSTFAGIYMAFPDPHEAIITVSVSIILTTIIIAVFITYFPQSKMFGKMMLSNSLSLKGGYVGTKEEQSKFIGRSGTATTDLNPAGKIEIDGEKVPVVSDGDFIAKGATVRVVSSEGNVLTVTKV